MKDKSEENLKSAKHLHTEGCYNSSIHCSYYACYQLMMYLDECIGSTHARPIGNNSHESFAILFVESYLESKIPEDECFEFENKIRELREQRNIADYKFKKCNINDSLNLLTNAENLIKILITKFNIIRYGN